MEQKADICCLQEVNDECEEALKQCFQHLHFMRHKHAELLMISRFTCLSSYNTEYGQCVLLDSPLGKTAAANVHLPWNRALKREKAIIGVVEALEAYQAEQTLLAGDFNCSEHSSVQRYLIGEQSLHGKEAYYFDLAKSAEEIYGAKAEATLDFRNNPRWKNGESENTIEINQRYDRILLKNAYPQALPVLEEAGVFGKEKNVKTGLCASDHYGVYAVLRRANDSPEEL